MPNNRSTKIWNQFMTEIINISQLAQQEFDESCTGEITEIKSKNANECSHIIDNLYQGRLPEVPNALHPHFKFVFNLSEIQYKVPRGVTLVHWHIDDAARLPNLETAHSIASLVTAARKIGPTLVHCAAGLNRSGLISALSLVESGMEPLDAVRLLRKQRSQQVLFNGTFCGYVLSLAKGSNIIQP